MRMTRSVTVNRPREEVFDYIADPNNDPDWCPTVLESSLVAGTPAQPGARYQQVQKPGPVEQQLDVELVEVNAPAHIRLRSSTSMATSQVDYELDADDGETRLRQTTDMHFHGLGYLMAPILRLVIPSAMEDQFKELKCCAWSVTDRSRRTPHPGSLLEAESGRRRLSVGGLSVPASRPASMTAADC